MAGKATGERIRGSTYRLICALAVQGETINQIATKAKCDWTTAKVIVDRESKSIQERKKEHADACLRVAAQAVERLEDQLHTINPGSLATIAGIMTDKALACSALPEANPNLTINLNGQTNLFTQFNQLVQSLGKSAHVSANPARDVPTTDASTKAEQTSAKAEQPSIGIDSSPT